MRRKRRYLLNTNVPLAAYYGSPEAKNWLKRHGSESYYSSMLRVELRRLRQRGVVPSVAAVLDVLRANGAMELSVDARKVLRRAKKLSDRGLFPRGLVFDAAHVLIAKENKLAIVSYDEDIERLAEILGAVHKKPWGRPYGPQDLPGSRGGEGGKRGEKGEEGAEPGLRGAGRAGRKGRHERGGKGNR